MPGRDPAAAEDGVSLVEVVVAVAILGLAVVALLGGLGTAVRGSDIHRSQATGETVVRSAAERVKDPGVAYLPCAGVAAAGAYVDGLSVPAGFAVSVAGVRVWDEASGAFVAPSALASCPSNDAGVQLVTVSVVAGDGRASETLDVVKRRR